MNLHFIYFKPSVKRFISWITKKKIQKGSSRSNGFKKIIIWLQNWVGRIKIKISYIQDRSDRKKQNKVSVLPTALNTN